MQREGVTILPFSAVLTAMMERERENAEAFPFVLLPNAPSKTSLIQVEVLAQVQRRERVFAFGKQNRI